MEVGGVFALAAVASTISWTVTQEEIFKEVRDWGRRTLHPKLAYLLGCYFCLCHWISLGVVLLAGGPLEPGGFIGWAVAVFVVAATGNAMTAGFHVLRVTLRLLRARADLEELRRDNYGRRRRVRFDYRDRDNLSPR